MAKMKAKNPYPQIGLAGAGFAVLLVILSVAELSNDASRALEWLSVGIPLAITSAYITYLHSSVEEDSHIGVVLFLVRVVIGGVGDIACMGGIYFAIHSASPSAAQKFLTVSVMAYIILSFGDVGLKAYSLRLNKKAQSERPELSDETAVRR